MKGTTCKVVAREQQSAKRTNGVDRDENAVDTSNMGKGRNLRMSWTLDDIFQEEKFKQ